MRNGSGVKVRLGLVSSTALTFFNSNNYGTPPSGGGGGGPLTIQDFSRDYLIYDSGAAAGLSSAVIPVSGTGPIGSVIEARAISQAISGQGTTAWTAIATVGGAGTYIGVLDVPLTYPWLKLETRLQVSPNTVATTVNRFAVGHVFALWGQSEPARSWRTDLDQLTPAALVTIKQQVLNLKNPGMSGRTSRKILNIASPSNLPAGATLSGNIVTITGSPFIVDWSFTNYQVEFANNSRPMFDECVFSYTDTTSISYLTYALVGSRAIINNCTFEGSYSFTSVAAAVKEQQTSIGNYGQMNIHRCRFLGLSADAIKLVAGSVRWSYGVWTRNTDAVGAISLWSSAATYNIGDHVSNSNGHVFRSLTNGNFNNAVPSTKTNTAFWANIDPHVDCITVEKSEVPVFIEYCEFDISGLTLANGGTGGNNYVRFSPNSGTSAFQNVHIRYCVFDRDPTEASAPFQIDPPFLGQVYFTGCWYRPKNGSGTSADIYPSALGQAHWAGMRHLDTNAFRTAPTGTIDESASFVDETNDYVIQHVYHDNVNQPNSGAAGVKHRPMTTASRHTSSFAAMANVALMERCGEKICFLHQTNSGTGFNHLFNDGDTTRYWDDDLALHQFGTAGGGNVGLAGIAWNSATAGLGLNLSIAIYEMVTKKNWTTGADLVAPVGCPSTNVQFTAQHFWGDIYNLSRTRWAMFGPNATGGGGNNKVNSLREIDPGTGIEDWDPVSRNYMRHAISHKNMMADARSVGVFNEWGPTPYCKSGATVGGQVDYAHPHVGNINGSPMYMTLWVHGLLQGSRLSKWVMPEFDQVFWDPAGAYVEVWSSQGDVTTMRKQKGMADLPATHAHWTDVFGFEWCVGSPNLTTGVGITPIQSALLVSNDGSGTQTSSGRVRILKPGGGTWAVGDTLLYGTGGSGTGYLLAFTDMDNDAWANRPVVMVGATGADLTPQGIPMRSLVQHTRP